MTGKYFADGSASEFSCDTLGRLTNSTTFDTQLNPLETVDMVYDFSNRLSRITYPGGKYLAFTYDENGRRLSSVDQLGHALFYTYDTAGRLQSMTNEVSAMVALFDYDPVGRLARRTVGNGLFTTYQYDPAGQLLNLTNSLVNGTVLSWFNYQYDSRGRRKVMQSLDGTWTYGYDDLGQLTHAVLASANTNIPNQELTYNYDAMGNRTVTIENGATNSYAVNNLNQYVIMGQTNYTFDADGNLIKEVSSAGTTTYTYNDENRLVAITSPQGTWSHGYNGLGSRTTMSANGALTRAVIDPTGYGNVVGEYDVSGNLLAHFDYGAKKFGLLSRTDSAGNASFYDYDAIGNVQQLVGLLGTIQNSYSYSPFGKILFSSEAIPNAFQFIGEFGVAKGAGNLSFMRNRFFTAATDKFTSADPKRLSSGDVNLYRYVFGNPLSMIDPIGLAAGDACIPVDPFSQFPGPSSSPSPPTPPPPPSVNDLVDDVLNLGITIFYPAAYIYNVIVLPNDNTFNHPDNPIY